MISPWYFADVPIGAPFHDCSGTQWLKVDRDHAHRCIDNFRCLFQGDEIVTVLPTGDE